MRRMFAVALAAVLAAGCNCPRLGPCASVDREGLTGFFSSWGSGCDDCCQYGGCYSGSRFYGPPANPRQLYRYSDNPNAPPESNLPLDPETVPPPPPVNGGTPSGGMST